MGAHVSLYCYKEKHEFLSALNFKAKNFAKNLISTLRARVVKYFTKKKKSAFH